MKANYLKRGLGLLALLCVFTAKAQTNTNTETANNGRLRMSYEASHTENGKRVDKIECEWHEKFYRITFVDEKVTGLYVDGEKIPDAEWGKYKEAIAAVRQQMKEQEKRNAEQAVRNQEQAKRNAEQEVRNKEQAVRDQEQEKRNAEQVARDREQIKKNEEQAIRNQEQEKRNAEQAVRNEEQARRNAEQEVRNKEQAKRNEERAQMIKDMTNDFVNDKIIPNTDGLHEMKLNEFGMSVNGVRQPEDVFKRYKAKYDKLFMGNFNYYRDGVIEGK